MIATLSVTSHNFGTSQRTTKWIVARFLARLVFFASAVVSLRNSARPILETVLQGSWRYFKRVKQ